MNKKIPVVVIAGPTASGKTELGVEIALKFSGEVISADSMQIYKGMHIASAAPEIMEMRGVPHHLVEFADSDTEFSVSDYVNLAKEKIFDVYSCGKLPVIVGGTGLYVNSLIDNIDFGNDVCDDALESEIEKEYEKSGGEKMLEKLAEFDPDYAAKLHPNDKKRIVRALQICIGTGSTVTERISNSKRSGSPFKPIMIAVSFKDRQLLYERINKRVDVMLEKGLIKEAEECLKNASPTSSQAIGHKEFADYFDHKCSLSDAVENLKMQTRRYAKRQLTWFRHDERYIWLYRDECDVTEKAIELVEKYLKEV